MGYLSQMYLRAPFSPIIRLTDGVALSRATPGLSNCFALSHMLSLLRFACRHDRHATTTSAFRPTQRRQKPSFFDKDIAFCLCQRARLKAFNSRHQACNCILPDIFCFFFAFRSLLVLKNLFYAADLSLPSLFALLHNYHEFSSHLLFTFQHLFGWFGEGG